MKSKLLFVLALLLSPVTDALAAPAAWVDANHMSLRYRLDGVADAAGGEVIVLLQESGLPLEVWDDFMPRLQKPGRLILRYDPRGVGLSEKFRQPITMRDHVEDLRALLDALQLQQPVTLIGGAIGGSIAMQFAALYPQRTQALFVTSPSAVTQTKAPRPRVNPALDPEGFATAAERTLDVTYPKRFRTDEAKWQRLRAMEGVNDFESEVLTEALINTTDFTDVLPRIECPTLLVATAVFPRPVDSVKALSERIPHAEFAVIESGHLAFYQTPELVDALLQRFLKAHVR